MQAYLISLEKGFTISKLLTAQEAKGKTADYIILWSNYEKINKQDLEIFKECCSSSKLPIKVEDQIITITRLIADKLLPFSIFPETNNFKSL